jgi:multicomponent Na+:H+ antiporter subunit G
MDGRLMLATAIDIVSAACLIGGVGFALIGAVGLIRFPDVFARMHAAGLIDTLAAALVLLGLALQAPTWLVAAKLLLIYLFILLTSPTATHALARAALHGGVTPRLGRPAAHPMAAPAAHPMAAPAAPEGERSSNS